MRELETRAWNFVLIPSLASFLENSEKKSSGVASLTSRKVSRMFCRVEFLKQIFLISLFHVTPRNIQICVTVT